MLENVADNPLTSEENDALAVKVRAGDLRAREELILGNIPLVKHKVKTWTTLYPHLVYLYDDMLSEGLVGLVRSVNIIAKTPKPDDNNVTGFISVGVTRTIGGFVAQEEIEPKISLPDWLANTLEDEDTTQFVDFVDSLLAACESEDHKTILLMKAKGASDYEIAQVLDCSRQTVQVMRSEIHQNWQENEE
jgi:DNA-directed RNA polymerase specialized sigma24 family protein